MKTNLLTLISIATATFLTSCEKEIEFNGEQTDPKLVINSLVEPGQPVSANISKSVFFLDNEGNTTAPDDLVATLFVNGDRIGEMVPHTDTLWSTWISYDHDGNPYHPYSIATVYSSTYLPAIGDVVKIAASANSFDDAEASTSPLPNAVNVQWNPEIMHWGSYYQHAYNIDTHEYEEDSILKIDVSLNLTIDITDPNPGQSDAFRLSIQKRKSDPNLENRISCDFEYDDPIFSSALPDNDFIDMSDLDLRPEGVFSDVLFDGRSYQLKIKLYFHMTLDEEYDPEFFQLPISIEHLSKEYYNYLNTCDQGDEVAFQMYAEPIQTFTNVKGGYGLVGGRTATTFYYAVPLDE